MSRSRKKFACVKGGAYGKYGKRLCNRKVRRASGLFQNCEYRKATDSWDIWDYRFVARPEEIKGRDWESKKGYISK